MRATACPMRFPPEARIRSGADFNSCFAARQRMSGRFFLLQWCDRGGPGPRLGLAVSRRVDRRAVARNRIKRLVREAFRLSAADLPALDLVLVARPDAAKASATALRADLAQLWQRLRALPPPSPQGTMPAACEPPDAASVTSTAAPPT